MNTPKINYRYTVTNRLGTSQPSPLGESEFKIEWTREHEERMGYKKEKSGKVVLRGAPYEELLTLERSQFRCDYIEILIERRCTATGAEVWLPLVTGRLSLNDGEWNLDRCEVEISVDAIDPAQCFIDHKNEEINLLEAVTARHEVRLYASTIEIETKEFNFQSFGSFNLCANPYWGDPGTPEAGLWTSYYHSYWFSTPWCASLTKWARMKMVVACGDPAPGAGWTLLTDTCPGGERVYIKPVALYDCEESESDKVKTRSCQIVGLTSVNYIDNGMMLADVLQAFADEFCEGMEVVSDFFQINPETPSATNYVTGEPTKTDKIVVFQKSDVKRPDAFNNATRADWTFERAIKALVEMFNVRWDIIDGALRVEHVSFFNKTAGLDLTAARYDKYVIGKRKYSYEKQNIPKKEVFKFMEASEGDFSGLPIFYSGACVTREGRESTKTHTADDVTTDVELCLSNPDADSDKVSDSGFVLVACEESGGELLVISEAGIFEGLKLNNSLAWAQLHRDYHRHYRPLQFGNLNGQDVEFLSVQPVRKGEKIVVPFCCDDEFNPDDTIKTALGDGIVDKAVYSFRDQTLELDLLYPIEDLTENAAPVATGEVANVVKNTVTDINVIANDVEAEPGDAIVGVQVQSGPLHGSYEILPNLSIRYTPDDNYLGPDEILYKVRDTWGNLSNTVILSITVIPSGALTLQLFNDNYQANKNTVLNEPAATGLLDNDTTSAGALTCTAETKPTQQGGTIQIFADGSFTYTPPVDYVGPDDFEYTASNGTDSDTANAHIEVLSDERHLLIASYTPTTSPIVEVCKTDGTFTRTAEATADATAANQRVQVNFIAIGNNGCQSFGSVIFEIGDTVKNVPGIEVCNSAGMFCTAITLQITQLIVVP